jgi:pimeloyl-ACP methyl ester carboxylesterase
MTEMNQTVGFNGVPIAYQSLGAGPAVLLVHGFLSNAGMNWLNPGTAAKIAAAGFRVILPDLRGHGTSGAPDDADAYPPDILAMDMEAVLAAEAVTHFHLVGYSLGARTAVRMMVRGAHPDKLVLGGMGLAGILSMKDRQDYFIAAIENSAMLKRGDAGYQVARFLKSTGTNATAAVHVLRSQITTTRDELAAIATPTLVISGDTDFDNGSAAELASALPHGKYAEINGDHMSAVINPALADTIIAFLTA